MKGEVQILRPLNCVLSGLVIIASGVIVRPVDELTELWIPLLLGAVAAATVAGAGNAINDYIDRKTDSISHPERPLPSYRIKPVTVLRLSAALFIIALCLSFFINMASFIIVTVAITLEIGYALYIHKRALGKNILVSILTAMLFLFGGSIVNRVFAPELLLLGALTFIVNLAREIIKDVEDIEGDRQTDRNTFPITYGTWYANTLAILLLFLGILCTPLPFLLGILNITYLPLGIVADVFLIYSILKISKPKKSQINIRYAMMVALAAFFVGSIL